MTRHMQVTLHWRIWRATEEQSAVYRYSASVPADEYSRATE